MKRFIFTVLIVLFLITACTDAPMAYPFDPERTRVDSPVDAPVAATEQPPVQNAPESPDSPQVNHAGCDFPYTLIPFNYTLTDIGNGWNAGSVILAFENRTSNTIFTEAFYADLTTIGSLTVETVEGPTYDAYYEESFTGTVWLPKGFRILSPYDYIEIYWESATAATPKHISFSKCPEKGFDLPLAQNREPVYPFDTPPATINPILALRGTPLYQNAEGISATFTGYCVLDRNKKPYLELSITNNDQFDNSEFDILMPYSIFYDTGKYYFNPPQANTIYGPTTGDSVHLYSIGPGQSEIAYLLLSNDNFENANKNSPILVLYWGENMYYELSDCVAKEDLY